MIESQNWKLNLQLFRSVTSNDKYCFIFISGCLEIWQPGDVFTNCMIYDIPPCTFSAPWNSATCLEDAFNCLEGHSAAFWIKISSPATEVFNEFLSFGKSFVSRNDQYSKVYIISLIL